MTWSTSWCSRAMMRSPGGACNISNRLSIFRCSALSLPLAEIYRGTGLAEKPAAPGLHLI
jgi:hypothetical protein